MTAPPERLKRNSPEWFVEWDNLTLLLKEWKNKPDDEAIIYRVTASLGKLGLTEDINTRLSKASGR